MPSRLWRSAAILVPSLLLAGVGAAGTAAAATTGVPTLNTSNFACSNGVCEVGPGNVGLPFGTMLVAVGQQCGTEGQTIPRVTGVASGSLPPGLQLGYPAQEVQITGTPTQAGTYSFAVQLANVNYASGQICGPTGTQQLTITIGTGNSDRLLVTSAGYNGHTNRLSVGGYDANVGALYSLSVTATGKQLIAPKSMTGSAGTVALVTSSGFRYPCPTNAGCDLTVTDSLGSSATIHLGPVKY